MTKKYDSTVARIAGNIASGMAEDVYKGRFQFVAKLSVEAARAIIAEVERTESPAEAK